MYAKVNVLVEKRYTNSKKDLKIYYSIIAIFVLFYAPMLVWATLFPLCYIVQMNYN